MIFLEGELGWEWKGGYDLVDLGSCLRLSFFSLVFHFSLSFDFCLLVGRWPLAVSYFNYRKSFEFFFSMESIQVFFSSFH